MNPEGKDLEKLLEKWRDHYGYEAIELGQDVPESPWTYRVELHYRDKSQYRFWAATVATIHKKIRENRPAKETK